MPAANVFTAIVIDLCIPDLCIPLLSHRKGNPANQGVPRERGFGQERREPRAIIRFCTA